jgi:hypothetical protein
MLTELHIIAFQNILIGLAFAGLLASFYETVTHRRAGFELLQEPNFKGMAFAPFVAATAPFLILRNTVRGRRYERRSFTFVMLATIIAGFWSLACGQLLRDGASWIAMIG